MKKAENKNIKIIAATSMAIFTLLTTFSATFAWFTSVREQDRGANDFTVNNSGDSVTCLEFHKFKSFQTVAGQKYYTFESSAYAEIDFDGSPIPSVSLNLGTYDIDDPHHPVLMLLEISGTQTMVRGETEETYIASNAGSLLSEDNPLSSVF